MIRRNNDLKRQGGRLNEWKHKPCGYIENNVRV